MDRGSSRQLAKVGASRPQNRDAQSLVAKELCSEGRADIKAAGGTIVAWPWRLAIFSKRSTNWKRMAKARLTTCSCSPLAVCLMAPLSEPSKRRSPRVAEVMLLRLPGTSSSHIPAASRSVAFSSKRLFRKLNEPRASFGRPCDSGGGRMLTSAGHWMLGCS